MPQQVTWDTALDRYVTYLRARRAAELTIRARRRHVGLFRQFVDPLSLQEVTLSDLRDYQCGLRTGASSRSARPLSSGTVAALSTDLRCFFRFTAKEGLLSEDPAARLERPKVAKHVPGVVLTVPEVRRMLTAANSTTPLGRRNRVVVETLYGTGLRRAELLALSLDDFRPERGELLVRAGKGEKARLVPVGSALIRELSGYVRQVRPQLECPTTQSSALFLSNRGAGLGEGGLRNLLKQLARRAEIERPVTPHTFRRTFATHLIQNGVSIRHIQALLGHESLNTTALYLRLDTSMLRRELLFKHPRERFEI